MLRKYNENSFTKDAQHALLRYTTDTVLRKGRYAESSKFAALTKGMKMNYDQAKKSLAEARALARKLQAALEQSAPAKFADKAGKKGALDAQCFASEAAATMCDAYTAKVAEVVTAIKGYDAGLQKKLEAQS